MRMGDRHVRHADRERRTADGGWEPNHTPYRDYTGIVYLNSENAHFSGGVLRPPVILPSVAGGGHRLDQNLVRTPSATSSGLRSISASPYRRSK